MQPFLFIKMFIVILRYRLFMGASKTDQFTKRQNEIAEITRALGHPARIAIIEYLLSAEGCICGDIVNELSLAQSTVSQHLKELRDAGLIKGNIEGNAVCYCIDEKKFIKFQDFLSRIFDSIKKQKQNCC